MQHIPIITLTTDFGSKDPLGGIMKGVILGINPAVRIIDLTHEVSTFNVREAALVIGMSYKQFPQHTIHVVVTDPGVGSQRKPITVKTEHYSLIGPDNGVFSLIYNENEQYRVIHLTEEHYFLRERSTTFDGRDIFAPVAAWLSKGIDVSRFGEEITEYVRLPFPSPSMPTRTTLEGEVILIDHFGNAITNIRTDDISMLRSTMSQGTLWIIMKGKRISLKQYYSQAEDKGLHALENSMGYLEIFVYRGNASAEFNIKVGDTIGMMVV
jgi:S-adenosyl-L-methionine hydrolase (adenosine-forming)